MEHENEAKAMIDWWIAGFVQAYSNAPTAQSLGSPWATPWVFTYHHSSER